MDQTKQALKEYILTEFLPGENPDELTDTVPLLDGGILDSIATLKLVAFVEERFGITVAPHETVTENFNTIDGLARYVHSKM